MERLLKDVSKEIWNGTYKALNGVPYAVKQVSDGSRLEIYYVRTRLTYFVIKDTEGHIIDMSYADWKI